MNQNSNYIDEDEDVHILYINSKLLIKKKSKYQNIEVYNDKLFGNILVIDDDLQLTELDERNYHEMLVHVPLNYNHNGKTVLIIGGGDGGTLREVCKYDNIEKIIMIEIDKMVIDISKEYFPKIANSYNDKRLELLILDGAKWIKENIIKYKNYFDFVLVDSTDYSTALSLFTEEFYKNISEILSEDGILSFNCMSISYENDEIAELYINMKKYYKYTNLYQVFIPTYVSGHYSFCFNSNKIDPLNTPIDFQKFNNMKTSCEYYNEDIHLSSFHLPNKLIKKVVQERLGTTYIIDAKNVSFNILNNYEMLKKILHIIVKLYKLTIVSESFKIFKPQGVTINILLAESHITIHTWPEKGKCCIDLFSCSDFHWNFININNGSKLNIRDILKYFFKNSNNDFNIKSINRYV
tara:strand:- start:266 stop:1492 length:1227 start_codon:yes stop_codon:yes gene_type:complete